MTSSDSPDPRDVPAQEEINRLQRAGRERGPVDFAAYLRFLNQFPDVDPAELRRRPTFSGEPFRL